jgi:hypothetical protein
LIATRLESETELVRFFFHEPKVKLRDPLWT